MVRTKKQWGLQLLEIYYEPVSVVSNVLAQSFYHACAIYSYETLNLPKEFRLRHKKLTRRIAITADSFSEFKKNYRNEIRRVLDDDTVTIKYVTGFSADGYALYRKFEQQAGRRPFSKQHAHGLWYLGYHQGRLVTGVFSLPVSPVNKVVAIFSLRKDVDEEAGRYIGKISKAVVSRAIEHSQELSCSFFDLAYINDTDAKKAGITAFKRGFGGEDVVEYLYIRELPLVRFLRSLRQVLLS